MAYVSPNFKTKKALREALRDRPRLSKIASVVVFQPGLGFIPEDGTVYLEGPHYPKPHTWYAEGTMKGGILVSIR